MWQLTIVILRFKEESSWKYLMNILDCRQKSNNYVFSNFFIPQPIAGFEDTALHFVDNNIFLSIGYLFIGFTLRWRMNQRVGVWVIVAGPKRGRPCRGFSITPCLCVCLCLSIKLQDLSCALRSHDHFEASHWMMDDG